MSIYSIDAGLPLLLLPPDLSAGSAPRSTVAELDEFLIDIGLKRQISRPALPNVAERIEFLLETRGKINGMLEFLNVVAGRYASFWLPTWNDDMDSVGGGFGNIIIRDIGYTERLFPFPAYRRLMRVTRADPTAIAPGPVSNAIDNGDGTETVFGLFGGGGGSQYRYMFNHVVRLDTDEVEIEYIHGELATVSLPIARLPEEM